MRERVSQYRGVYDAHATYARLRDAGVLGSHSYLHVRADGAEIGWAPGEHLRLTEAEFGPDWQSHVARIAESAARVNRKAFGFVGFDAVDGVSPTRPDGSPGAPPLVEFIVPGEMVTFSGGEQVTHHSSSGFDLRPYLTMRLPAGREPHRGLDLEPVAAVPAERFIGGVRSAVAGLLAGEAQKVVLSRFQAFDLEYDPVALFAAHFLTPRFVDAFLISFGDVVAVVASPEVLLDSRGRRITSNPLAGTRPRGATVEADERLRNELKQDHKEIVEHVLSVTTMLSQLEPFCDPDTLVVSRLMEICVQQNVQHLSSVIRGTLGRDWHVLDALWALFPGVTIAGFPSGPAVRMLRELESGPRCLYSGILGWVSGDSECRFSLAIRGMFRYGTRTFLHAGAGIVPESVPESEFTETQHKLAITRSALAGALAGVEAGVR
jgi:anthranilate/para-aminobenzoate synthase component I